MKTSRIIAILVPSLAGSAIIIAVVVAARSSLPKAAPAQPVVSPAATVSHKRARLDVEELSLAYLHDPVGASRLYGGKTVEVFGHVSRTGFDDLHHPYFLFETHPEVDCRLSLSDAHVLSIVKPGDSFLVKGQCVGLQNGSVQLTDCQVNAVP